MTRSIVCWIFLLIAMFVLIACNKDTDESTISPGLATSTPTAAPVVIVVPTVTPASAAPTEAQPKTEQPIAALPTGTPTSIPQSLTSQPLTLQSSTVQPIPAPVRVGLIRFRDNEYARAGNFIVLSNNLPIAPLGSHYDLWLTKDGGPLLRLGTLPSQQAQLSHTGNADQNLLSVYQGALLSLEPDLNTPSEIGPTVMEGTLPLAILPHIHSIAFRTESNPDGQGHLIGAEGQLQLARQHTGFLSEALVANNQPEVRRHAEHVINIVNGKEGDPFGDLDGDGVPQNPGDGVGVVGYLLRTKEQANLAANHVAATAEVKLHAGHVLVSSDNALGWLSEASELALRVLAADSTGEAQPAADALAAILDKAHTGVDANNDGTVLPIPGEGGLLAAYEHTLNMGTIELFPVGDLVASPAASAAAPAVPTVVMTPTAADAGSPPAAEHGADHTQPTPAPVTVEMRDFEFQPAQVTIQRGTTVTWVNKDGVQHSTTADDGSFDTGLFGSGGSASVVFDQPGAYRYYCQLHGGASGQGMSAQIVVE